LKISSLIVDMKPCRPFWETKQAAEMTVAEWESLCDGCGQCCLHKLEDEDTGEILYTWIACRLLDLESCTCLDYRNRMALVENCIRIERDRFERLQLRPETCAYRLLSEGKPLPQWHPLITGDPETVHEAGVSIRNKAVSEESIHPTEFAEFLQGK